MTPSAIIRAISPRLGFLALRGAALDDVGPAAVGPAAAAVDPVAVDPAAVADGPEVAAEGLAAGDAVSPSAALGSGPRAAISGCFRSQSSHMPRRSRSSRAQLQERPASPAAVRVASSSIATT